MSESEKFEFQGRAHAQLKEARSNIATLRSRLKGLPYDLQSLAAAVEREVRDPSPFDIETTAVAGRVRQMGDLLGVVAPLFEELRKESKRARELEALIADF